VKTVVAEGRSLPIRGAGRVGSGYFSVFHVISVDSGAKHPLVRSNTPENALLETSLDADTTSSLRNSAISHLSPVSQAPVPRILG